MAKQKDLSLVNIPVIVVSNSGQPVEIKRALALGVKDYVVKAQFEPEEVLAKVKSLFDADVRLPSSISSLEQEINRKNGGDKTSLEGKKIVWVEDDQFLNDIIARKLSATKAVFLNASDGEEALKIISEEMPDIVMLDIILSGMDGFEVLSEIKNNPKTKHIPVIMLSNLGQPGDVAKGESLGASLFLIKATVTPNEIIDKIGEVLTKHSLSDREDSES
jgi:CheY-like chemotaxis protein